MSIPTRTPQAPHLPAQLESGLPDAGELADAIAFGERRIEPDVALLADVFDVDDWHCLDLRGVMLADADMKGITVRDTRFTDASLANAVCCRGDMWERVAIHTSQCTGARWWDALLRDVQIEDSNLRLASFRFSKMRTVRFEDCDLREADFSGANLEQVRFERCDLRGADFDGATIKHSMIDGCDMEELRGLGGLRGMSIPLAQVWELAPQLAAALGIDVVVPPSDGD